MNVKFKYSKISKKFLDKHLDLQNKFEKNISEYSIENKNVDIITLKGYKPHLRMAIDSYRIIFKTIDDEILIIDVVLAGNRGDIYKKLKNLK